MKLTQANRRMLANKGLVVQKTTQSITIYRVDGRRMTKPQYTLVGDMMRKAGLFKLPK